MPRSFREAPVLVAGPCMLEPGDLPLRVAETLAALAPRLGIPVCFKGSFDKANRAGARSPRGPGLEEGLRQLQRIREQSGLPVLTDVHEAAQVEIVAGVVDTLQIPAFLCRQTDLIVAAARTGLPLNLKKGQWMAPEEMAGAVEKANGGGAADVAVTERGTSFGYGDLVVDMRSFRRMRRATGATVLFDATHAVQQSGRGPGGSSGGAREQIPSLLLAAAAAGADGFYLETHPRPEQALSDAGTQWPLAELESLVQQALEVWHAARSTAEPTSRRVAEPPR